MNSESVITQEDAEEYTQALGQNLGGSYRQILLGKKLGVPQALGLTVEEWVTQRLGGYVRLTVEDRRAASMELTSEGLSQREAAEVLGVSPMTIGRDLSTVTNVTEDPDADSLDTVTNVTEVNPDLTIICGDALTELRKLPDAFVQCCVTSPPYWGLRDYGTAKWKGGSIDCDHVANPNCTKEFGNPEFNEDRPSREATKTAGYYFADVCGKCGAARVDEQLGLEATPEEYVGNMAEVFREVRRVLRDDGTLWLALGDCYVRNNQNREIPRSGLKPKDLCGIPWRLALALQADGYYLRSEIIWAKSNPVPESVTDRPTKSHETIFLLTKSPQYYYDAEAIREVAGEIRSNRIIGKRNQDGTFRNDVGNMVRDTGFRNKRSVWTIATQPYSGAHFATFPEELPKLCILAGSNPGDTVLDPFAGSGTTGKVALELSRSATLIELNQQYIKLINERCMQPQLASANRA